MRRLVLALTLVPSTALAEDDEVPVIEEDVDLTAVEHEGSVAYDLRVTAGGDAGGTSYVLASVGGEAGYTTSFGRDRSEYEIHVEGAASVSRLEGTVRATGATTRLSLALGPAPAPIGNQDLAHTAPFPLTFELEHEGSLAALPAMSDRPRVLAAPYVDERLRFSTRAYMVEYAEDGEDERPGFEEHRTDRESGGLELFPVRSEIALTGQDAGTRFDAAFGAGLFGVVGRAPDADVEMTGDVVLFERRATQLPDGAVATLDVLWVARAQITNPATGSAYRLGYGWLLDQDTPAPRARTRDHTGEPGMGYFGLFSDPRRPLGGGFQWNHEHYVTMAGAPALEDKLFVEGWARPSQTTLTGRVFVARNAHDHTDGTQVTWTGGVEVDARRDLGPVAVGLHAEGGHSYYATLDGGAPSAGFGARAALTVQRGRKYYRGTR